MSVSFVVKLMAALRATGSLKAKPEGGWRYSKLDPNRDFLMCRVAEKDDITMPELAAERSYWLTTHPDTQGVRRVTSVADFITETVRTARDDFLLHPAS